MHLITKWIEKYSKWLGIPLVVVMAMVGFSLAIIKPAAIAQFELKSLDFRFLARGELEPDPRVAIIAVDDNALSEIGRWPWSRDKIAEVVDKVLGQYGAKALGFDMVFSEDQTNVMDEALRLLHKNMADINGDSNAIEHMQWLEEQRVFGDVDAVLERTLSQHKDKLVPGYFFYPQAGNNAPDLVKNQLEEEAALMRSLAMTSSFSKEALHSLPHIAAIEGNIPRVTKAVDAIGFFNFFLISMVQFAAFR
ncbi:MAG: CHASE2 domain-containing protein [Ghiorsea sp.]|nr:CHASE2 domain-containing protein [Ghiorsea sp.]